MADVSARVVARFDGWTLRRTPLELSRGDQPVRLQEQPLQILEALVGRPGQLVTREELIARLWPDTVVDFDAGLNTAVRKLRAALADDADAPRYLERVPRQGYRFIGAIERPDSDPSIGPAGVADDHPSQPDTARRSRRDNRHWLRAGVALAGVVLLAALAFAALRRSDTNVRDATSSSRSVDRLAVLPFENSSPDPEYAFFADGIHEELLSALGARARDLEVISRTTMLMYRGRPTDVRALSRELGATRVLEGSVRREADTVRVSLRLIDAIADRQLWSHSYQATLVDAMTLQTQLAREVAEQLAVQLSTATAARLPPPRNPEAYDLWLKGTLAWQQAGAGGATSQEIDRVEAMFTRAIALDETYGAAYADRARIRIARLASHAEGSDANIAGARTDIALAQKYAGGTPYVLVRAAQLASLVDHDVGRAIGLIEAAEQVGPLNADLLLTKGNFLMFAGRLDESLAVQAQAARLDPGNPSIYRYWVSNLAAAHRPAEMMKVLKDFDARFPARLYRGEYLFGFTGSTARWWQEIERLRSSGDANVTLSAEFDLLRYERRFDELRARLAAPGPSEFGQHTAPGSRVGASVKPIAELRGWERLLAGDASGAARNGRVLDAFITKLPQASWNEWWRRLLGAESAIMLGDHARAIDQARTAARLTTGRSSLPESVYIRMMAARVLAWAGALDESVTLLEALAHEYPGVGPAAIVRDPFFSTPLARNVRWQALERTLNAELASNAALLR